MMRTTLLLLFSMVTLVACSVVPSLDKVLPDKRDEYKKSEALPDLEIPPDLTAASSNQAMNIPGEGASLKRYKEQTSHSIPGGTTGVSQTNPPAGGTTTTPDQAWVSVQGSTDQIWPRLRTFFSEKNLTLTLDDMELGVMETGWTTLTTQSNAVYREKFKIFSEAGADTAITVLYVNNLRQEKITKDDGTNDWIDRVRNSGSERQLAGELNLFFNKEIGNAGTANVAKSFAELQNLGGGKALLSIPKEFTYAWRHTELALERAGFVIDNKDQTKGLYYITYYDTSEKKKGWMSKIKFWQKDGSEGIPYQISLTGVGNKTEVIVLNKNGDWEDNEDAGQILNIIQTQYNNL